MLSLQLWQLQFSKNQIGNDQLEVNLHMFHVAARLVYRAPFWKSIQGEKERERERKGKRKRTREGETCLLVNLKATRSRGRL